MLLFTGKNIKQHVPTLILNNVLDLNSLFPLQEHIASHFCSFYHQRRGHGIPRKVDMKIKLLASEAEK